MDNMTTVSDFPELQIDCHYYTDKWKPNQCGSKVKGILSITYHILPNWCFANACDCHDYAYFLGGCKLIDDSVRYKADREFYLQMIETINNKVFFRKPFLKLMAKAYYEAVRSFGEKSFNWFPSEELFNQHKLKYNYIISEKH